MEPPKKKLPCPELQNFRISLPQLFKIISQLFKIILRRSNQLQKIKFISQLLEQLFKILRNNSINCSKLRNNSTAESLNCSKSFLLWKALMAQKANQVDYSWHFSFFLSFFIYFIRSIILLCSVYKVFLFLLFFEDDTFDRRHILYFLVVNLLHKLHDALSSMNYCRLNWPNHLSFSIIFTEIIIQ